MPSTMAGAGMRAMPSLSFAMQPSSQHVACVRPRRRHTRLVTRVARHPQCVMYSTEPATCGSTPTRARLQRGRDFFTATPTIVVRRRSIHRIHKVEESGSRGIAGSPGRWLGRRFLSTAWSSLVPRSRRLVPRASVGFEAPTAHRVLNHASRHKNKHSHYGVDPVLEGL